jgi:hypothetical protein
MNHTYPIPQDWHNYHYNGRQGWLTSPWPDPDRKTLFMKFQALLSRFTGHVGQQLPDCPPELATDCVD